MAEKKRARQLHPQGAAPGETEAGHRAVGTVETYGRPVRLRWDPDGVFKVDVRAGLLVDVKAALCRARRICLGLREANLGHMP